MKVYIVTSGDYDDYRIDEVFSTKEKAEEYIECFGDKCSIEEYNLDNPIEPKENIWYVNFKLDGNELNECIVNNYGKVDSMRLYGGGNFIYFRIMSNCRAKAMEIAKERLDNVIKNKDSKYKKLFVGGRNNWFSDFIDYNTGEIIE